MKKNSNIKFEFSLSGRSDGTLEAVYVRVREGKVRKTVEIEQDILLCDYDNRGNLLGFEILAPVKLSRLVRQAPDAIRNSFRRFVRNAVPGDLVLAS